MGRIVVGVDGSANGNRALQWAVDEAATRGDEIEAVTTWSYPYNSVDGFVPVATFDPAELEGSAAKLQADAIEATIADVDARKAIIRTVAEGSPARVLMEKAKDADMLVVGSRGHGGFMGLLLGSVSSQCVHHAKCPVVVIRPED